MNRRLAVLVACLVILAAGMTAPSVARGADGLIVTSQAVYEVRPEEQRIDVIVNVAATNVTPDTATELTFYTGVSLPIPPDATQVSASSGSAALGVAVEFEDDVAYAEVAFASDLFFQDTYRFSLRFSLTDSGGDPGRETWIRSRFVAFPVWSFGTPGASGASVEVILPAGFDATAAAGGLEVQDDGDAVRLVSTTIDDPAAFFAYVTAERATERARTRLEIPLAQGDESVILFSWPDDPDWRDRVESILVRGLPVLEEEIGVPYPLVGVLNVTEHAYAHLGDYAGFFIPGDDAIEIRFDADAFTTLHEAAHIWFNDDLADERWLGEAFASYYAELVGTALGESLVTSELTDDLREHAFPLVEWGDPGQESLDREDYGYAATHEVARLIAALAGPDGLRAVWRAEDVGRMAYAIHDDERPARGDAAADEWQRLLDLFEVETGADFDPIWVEWIVGDDHNDLLAAREEARDAYALTTTALDDWEMPRSTRVLMEAWDFAPAMAELAAVTEVSEEARMIATAAGQLDLSVTDGVAVALASDGIEAAGAEAESQSAALATIRASALRLERPLAPTEQVGLIGELEPSTLLDAARAAFEAGDVVEAGETAVAAAEALDASADRGRLRVSLVGGGILLLDAAFLGLLIARRRRAHARAGTAPFGTA